MLRPHNICHTVQRHHHLCPQSDWLIGWWCVVQSQCAPLWPRPSSLQSPCGTGKKQGKSHTAQVCYFMAKYAAGKCFSKMKLANSAIFLCLHREAILPQCLWAPVTVKYAALEFSHTCVSVNLKTQIFFSLQKKRCKSYTLSFAFVHAQILLPSQALKYIAQVIPPFLNA